MNNIPKFKIGNSGKTLEVNLIQGGMGVGISLSGLASAVANEGGAGIIASVGIGGLKKYPGNYAEANAIALKEEIKLAREKSKGVIGVNIMHALSDYSSLVKTAVEENVDLIISGAGIPRDLPKYLKVKDKNGKEYKKDIKLIPIVSSVRVLKIIYKAWERQGYIPDAIVVEGPKAGGHLGFSREQLNNPEFVKNALEEIVSGVVEESRQFGNIPVIAAGGIFDGTDIAHYLKLGASGVQMATRFVPTYECDASQEFKNEYLRSKKEDIIVIDSPVGMPGRAIRNKFLEKVEKGIQDNFKCDYKCLKTCNPNESPYCIANALIEAQQGDFRRGYAFAGTNAYKCNEIISVKNLMQKLSDEYSLSISD